MPDYPDPELDAQSAAAELEAVDAELLAQLPKPPPPVAFDMSTDSPLIGEESSYSTEPPNLRTIPLLHDKYNTRSEALARARELAAPRGERVYRLFYTARAWVAQFHKPAKVGEGIR